MGGAELQLKAAKGLDLQPDSNKVLYENNDFGDYLGKFAVEGRRTSDDAYSSMTPAGKLAFTTPSYEELTGFTLDQLDQIELFDYGYKPQFEILVGNSSGETLRCPSGEDCGL